MISGDILCCCQWMKLFCLHQNRVCLMMPSKFWGTTGCTFHPPSFSWRRKAFFHNRQFKQWGTPHPVNEVRLLQNTEHKCDTLTGENGTQIQLIQDCKRCLGTHCTDSMHTYILRGRIPTVHPAPAVHIDLSNIRQKWLKIIEFYFHEFNTSVTTFS